MAGSAELKTADVRQMLHEMIDRVLTDEVQLEITTITGAREVPSGKPAVERELDGTGSIHIKYWGAGG